VWWILSYSKTLPKGQIEFTPIVFQNLHVYKPWLQAMSPFFYVVLGSAKFIMVTHLYFSFLADDSQTKEG
jgi:hypothetical protein